MEIHNSLRILARHPQTTLRSRRRHRRMGPFTLARPLVWPSVDAPEPTAPRQHATVVEEGT